MIATHSTDRPDPFWLQADRSGGPDACWLWLGQFDRTVDGLVPAYLPPAFRRRRIARRVAYELAFGPIERGRVVARCGSPTCVNPAHLALSLERRIRDDHRGGGSPRQHLREGDVRDIRARAAAGIRQSELAAEYLVTEAAVSMIVSRKIWPHVLP